MAILETFRQRKCRYRTMLDNVLPRHEVEFPSQRGMRRIYVVRADETGGLDAQDLLRRILDQLKPDLIFFVGCAALLDERHKISENLVFVARSAIDTDKRELGDGKTSYSMLQHHGDLTITRNIAALSDAGNFRPIVVKTNRDFVSGSAFSRDRNSELRRDIVSSFPPDAAVLEMEAFAVFKAMFSRRAEGVNVSVAVVKGISDTGDANAQENKDQSQQRATKKCTRGHSDSSREPFDTQSVRVVIAWRFSRDRSPNAYSAHGDRLARAMAINSFRCASGYMGDTSDRVHG